MLVNSARRVFQSWRRPAELVESLKHGIQVCLVEGFAAAQQVAFDRENFDCPPLGVEALLRSPLQGLSDDCSEFAQPMHGLDADVKVRRYIPHGANSCDQINSP